MRPHIWVYIFIMTILPMNVHADEALRRAVEDNPFRHTAEKARDVYRHPYETLRFFGIRPDMAVAEVGPGGGWYTNILAPYLKAQGHYTAVNYAPGLMPDQRRRAAMEAWGKNYTADTAKFGLNAKTAFMAGVDPMVPPDSLDLIMTTREWHNWIASGLVNTLAHEFYRSLKPGGVLGVVQHRANPKIPVQPGVNTGYVDEATLIAFIENAGFRLEAKSEINANPKDSANWPNGVWTLPPAYALRDQDRDLYTRIGESDRMTLKFVKPQI